MITLNNNFLRLQKNYLFVDIAKRVEQYKKENPQASIIRLGIGDVTRPLAPAVIQALHAAVDEQAEAGTFRGYGPEQGYEFLRQAIVDNVFKPRGVEIDVDEVFINDGAKSDTGNFGDILGGSNTVLITDPVYPVYIDTNVMAGRAGTFGEGRWDRITYAPCTAENNFTPSLPTGEAPDMIYLCYPNNPTGTVLCREELQKWVDYALENGSLILYDAAYAAYIRHDNIPRSIYEIPGAKRCAVEFHSYSKTAGFTGLRCGFTIVPNEVCARSAEGEMVQLNPLWNRRQCTKFNGVSYVTQRAAEAIYSPVGWLQTKEVIAGYMRTAGVIRKELTAAGYTVFGGEHAPYIWWKIADGEKSFDFFDRLLATCEVVGTPGSGFGPCGEGYFRLTAFGDYERTCEALRRIREKL